MPEQWIDRSTKIEGVIDIIQIELYGTYLIAYWQYSLLNEELINDLRTSIRLRMAIGHISSSLNSNHIQLADDYQTWWCGVSVMRSVKT